VTASSAELSVEPNEMHEPQQQTKHARTGYWSLRRWSRRRQQLKNRRGVAGEGRSGRSGLERERGKQEEEIIRKAMKLTLSNAASLLIWEFFFFNKRVEGRVGGLELVSDPDPHRT